MDPEPAAGSQLPAQIPQGGAPTTLALPANGEPRSAPWRDPYQGASMEPFPESVQAALRAQVDPDIVEITPDGRVYVPAVHFRKKLTQAFGSGGWALVPRGPFTALKDTLSREYALFCYGRFVSEARGEQDFIQNNPNTSEATATEGVHSNAITRVCKDLCIYSELWDRSWTRRWKKQHAVQVWCANPEGKKRMFWRRKDDPEAIQYPWRESQSQPAETSQTERKPREAARQTQSQPQEAPPPQNQPATPPPAAPPQPPPAATQKPAETKPKDDLGALHQRFWIVLKQATKTLDEAVARKAMALLTGKDKVRDLSKETLLELGPILNDVAKDMAGFDASGSRVVDRISGAILWPKGAAAAPPQPSPAPTVAPPPPPPPEAASSDEAEQYF